MADGSVVISVDLDNKGFKHGIKAMRSELMNLAKGTKLEAPFKALDTAATKTFSGVAKAAKVGMAAATAATTATVGAVAALGKQALDSYAKYEQMTGGIDKLFGAGPAKTVEEYAESVGKSTDKVRGEYAKLTKASQTVQDNAQKAYRTAGMSANAYMESVTGFSAALINSLGGDTKKAADMADVAMRSISDNANTFGTDSEQIVLTYQSLARGQYAMLDNLKLGYGGTKAEIKRLVDDANKYASTHKEAAAEIGVSNKMQADSYSDVVAAIELIQQKQGIAGTTAREAATTIEGSVNSAKAAWENWVTELGKDDADIDARTRELVDSAVTAASNIIPRIGVIMENLGVAVRDEMPRIGKMVNKAMEDVDLEGGLESMLKGIDGFYRSVSDKMREIDFKQAANDLLTSLGNAVGSVDWSGMVADYMPALLASVGDAVTGVAEYLQDHGDEIATGVVDVLATLASTLVESAPMLLTAAGTLLNSVIDGAGALLNELIDTFILDPLADLGTELLVSAQGAAHDFETGFYEGLSGLGDSISTQVNAAIENAKSFGAAMQTMGSQFMTDLGNGVAGAASSVSTAAAGAINGAKDAVMGVINGAASWGSDLVNNIASGIWGAIDAVRDAAKAVADAISSLLHHSVPDEGPLMHDDEWGGDFVDNIVRGIRSKAPDVGKAALGVADEMRRGIEGGDYGFTLQGRAQVDTSALLGLDGAVTARMGATYAAPAPAAQGIDYGKLAAAMAGAMGAVSLNVDSRQLSSATFSARNRVDGSRMALMARGVDA